MNPLKTVDGAALMSRPLQPVRFVVDTLLSQGLHILAGPVAGGDGSQGRAGVGPGRQAGHHPLSLSGGLHAAHPEPAL